MTRKRPYDSRTWQRVRRQVLERDGYRCQLRMARCKLVADAVHHLTDWRSGGDWYAPENLVASCTPCNTAEANKRNAAKRRRTPAPYLDW